MRFLFCFIFIIFPQWIYHEKRLSSPPIPKKDKKKKSEQAPWRKSQSSRRDRNAQWTSTCGRSWWVLSKWYKHTVGKIEQVYRPISARNLPAGAGTAWFWVDLCCYLVVEWGRWQCRANTWVSSSTGKRHASPPLCWLVLRGGLGRAPAPNINPTPFW